MTDSSSVDLTHFKKFGFLLLRNFFEPSVLCSLREEAKNIFKRQLSLREPSQHLENEIDFEKSLYRFFEVDAPTFMNCGKQIQHLINLHRLSLDELILKLLKDLNLKSPVINTRPTLMFNSKSLAKSDNYWKVPAHQDWRSMQGSADSVVIWLPLVDVNKRNGALEVFPGSHKQGLRNTTWAEGGFGVLEGDLSQFGPPISIEMNVGDLLVFSSYLVHQSGNNSTDTVRWSCQFRFSNLEEESFLQRGYPHSFIYKPMEQLLTPDYDFKKSLKKIFGIDS